MKISIQSLFLTAFLFMSASSARAGSLVDSKFTVQNLRGIYSVPVAEPELAEAAQFEVPVQLLTETNSGKTFLRFSLPAELLGKQQTFLLEHVSQSSAQDLFEGENAHAECARDLSSVAVSAFECSLRFDQIQIDLPLAKSSLEAKGFSESRVKAGVRVATRFGGDPVGTVKYRLSDSYKQ